MMVSITGTPCVGKTTISREFEEMGWTYIDLKSLIIESNTFDEVIQENHEILVDEKGLKEYLGSLDPPEDEDIILDGHLSYLAPSDICIVLRLNPKELKNRLSERGYSERKVNENVEAEAVSVILVEALEMEEERLGGKDWKQLPPACGIVFEIDTSNKPISDIFQQILNIINGYRGKRLNELLEYRPGRVDWLEEMFEWF
jgi:adenylate kinase